MPIFSHDLLVRPSETIKGEIVKININTYALTSFREDEDEIFCHCA